MRLPAVVRRERSRTAALGLAGGFGMVDGERERVGEGGEGGCSVLPRKLLHCVLAVSLTGLL